MSARSRKRILAFERLESKAIPSSLLVLLVASSDPDLVTSDSVEVGQLHSASSASSSTEAVAAGSKWQFNPDPARLLCFVAEETSSSSDRSELEIYLRPTQQQCDGADAMMKLDDDELRTMILQEQHPV